MTGAGRKIWRASAAVFAAVVILLAVVLGVFRLALTQVPERREQIRDWAAGAVGLPVELGTVDGRLGLRGPELTFTGARILAADGDGVLIAAREGAITLDLFALLTGRIRPGRILLSGVSVTLLRDAGGTWQLLGPEGPALGGGAGGLPAPGGLPVSEVRLADLEVSFEDRQHDLGPWVFRLPYVDLVAEGDAVRLEASVGFPEALGRGLSVEARMAGRDESGLPLGWSARVDLRGLELAAGRNLAAGADWYPEAGRVDAEFEIAGSRGRPERLLGGVQARDLAMPANTPYERLSARFDWSGGETGWQLRLSDLEVERDDRRWSSPTARLELGGTDGSRVVYGDADYLRLEDLAPLAALLPPEPRALLADLRPRGGLRGIVARSGPAEDGGRRLAVEAALENVGFEPAGRVPGLANVSGRLEGDLDGGTLAVDAEQVELRAPALFRDPLRFEALDASLDWRRDEAGLRLRATELVAANRDARLDGEASLLFPGGGSPADLEIHARVRDVDASATSRYLPVGIMPPGVVAWLDRAIVSGRVPEAIFELRGPSRGFPYRQDQGVFRVSFPVEDLVLDFAEGWPRAEAIGADVLFENEALFADVTSGRMMGLDAGPVAVQIPDLARGRLGIEGRARGTVAAGRDWALATGMLRRILEPGLEPAQVRSGELVASVDLELPLGRLADNDVRVDLDLSGVDVAFGFLGAPVEDLSGTVRIHGARVTGENLRADVAGRPVALELGPTATGATRLGLSGRASVATVDALFALGFTGHARGEADWRGFLEFPGGAAPAPFRLEFGSDLAGVAIDLPAPVGKPADEPREASLSVAFPEEGVQDWRVDAAPGLFALFRLETVDGQRRLGRVRDLPEGMLPPGRDGVVIGGRVSRLKPTAWAGLAAGTGGDGLPAAFAGAAVTVGELVLSTGTYRETGLRAGLEGDTWTLVIDGEALRGQVRIPASLDGDRRIEGDLERLDIFPPAKAAQAAAAQTGPEEEAAPDGGWRIAPERVPPMFFKVEDLGLGELRLGAALLDVVRVPGGFELERLDGGGESFKFTTRGRVVQSAAEDSARLRLELTSTNLEDTLRAVGYAPALTGERGSFVLDLQWTGGLRSDVVTAMEGTARLELENGRLTTVDTGAGRIFGLLSLQALPRRLTLDFSDVFTGGLAYDRIEGDFEIVGGDAYTTNFVLRGPTVDMGVVGRIGLVDRDYDQTAVVSADLGAAVPVAGVIAGGPIVGAALWVLSEALRNPLRSQVTYRITGPWDAPVVERAAAGTRAPTGAKPGTGSPPPGEPPATEPGP